MAVTPGRHSAPGGDEAAPLISIRQAPSSSRSTPSLSRSVMKWEETKKWQKKVDTLHTRLSEKTREAESATGHVTSLREAMERCTREKQLLQERNKTLQKTVSNLEKTQRDARVGNSSSVGGSHGDRKTGYRGDVNGDHAPSSEELQRVISAMRKVVEKLQSENEKLRREALIRTTRQQQGKKVAVREREGREREKGEKMDVVTSASTTAAVVPVAKLATENEKLQRSLRREMERTRQLQVSLKTAEIERGRFQDEVGQWIHTLAHTHTL